MSKASRSQGPKDIHESFTQFLRSNNVKRPVRDVTCKLCPASHFSTTEELEKHIKAEHASQVSVHDGTEDNKRDDPISVSPRRKRQADTTVQGSPRQSGTPEVARPGRDTQALESSEQLQLLHLSDIITPVISGDLHTNKKRGIGQGQTPESSVSSDNSVESTTSLEVVRNKQSLSTPRILTRDDRSSKQKLQHPPASDFVPRAKVASRALFDPRISTSPHGQTSKSVLLQNSHIQSSRGTTSNVPSGETLLPSTEDSSPVPAQRGGILPASGLNLKGLNPGGLRKQIRTQKTEVRIASPSEASTQMSDANDGETNDDSNMVLQLKTPSTSSEHLLTRIKGIYAGLLMIEEKCTRLVREQMESIKDPLAIPTYRLNHSQYRGVLQAHTALLSEYYDFLLASQHPNATPGVRRLASRYAIPGRLWKHGIHGCLELLRQSLPDSIEYMLAFIYQAYSILTLLVESISAFEDTWVECLGDLARYRMAIIDRSQEPSMAALQSNATPKEHRVERALQRDAYEAERRVWCAVATEWYTMASIAAPDIGRLYHHLAILSQGGLLKSLFYYGKALSVKQSFATAWETVRLIFRASFGQREWDEYTPQTIRAFFALHSTLFVGKRSLDLDTALNSFTSGLDSFIFVQLHPEADTDFRRTAPGFLPRDSKSFFEDGYLIALCNIQALMGYGKPRNLLWRAIAGNEQSEICEDEQKTSQEDRPEDKLSDEELFVLATNVFTRIAETILSRRDDDAIFGYVHCTLVFLLYLADLTADFELVTDRFPWSSLAAVLNRATQRSSQLDRTLVSTEQFPLPQDPAVRPFPEDFAMLGLPMTKSLYPDGFFKVANIDFRSFASHADVSSRLVNDKIMDDVWRPIRVSWLGRRLTKKLESHGYMNLLAYDIRKSEFATTTIVSANAFNEDDEDDEEDSTITYEDEATTDTLLK